MRPGRDVAQRLGGQEHGDAIGGAPERRRLGADVAQFEQRVVYERVIHDVEWHEQMVVRKMGRV
jgi:hypothetical protein